MNTRITEQEGINILEVAGYEVTVTERTFAVYSNGNKKYGCSNRGWLQSLDFIIKHVIQEHARSDGFEAGKNKMQRDIKKLLNIDDKPLNPTLGT